MPEMTRLATTIRELAGPQLSPGVGQSALLRQRFWPSMQRRDLAGVPDRMQTSFGKTVQASFVPVLQLASLVHRGMLASSLQMPRQVPPDRQPPLLVQARLLSLLQKPRH